MSVIGKTLNSLNFNLKNEFFSYFRVKDTLNLIAVFKTFKFAVENNKCFRIIKESFDKFISESSLIFSEMDVVNKLLIEKGESQSVAFDICLYLSIKNFKNFNKINIKNKNFTENEKNYKFLNFIISFNNSVKKLNLSGNNLGANDYFMIHLKEALEINESIQELNLSANNIGKNEKFLMYLKEALSINHSIK